MIRNLRSSAPARMTLRRPAAESAPAPLRRVVRRASPEPGLDHEQAIKDALAELDTVDTQLANLATRRAELENTVAKHMEAGKLTYTSNGQYEALVKEIKSRAHRDIDARKFFDLLAERGPKEEDAAWDALQVSVTEAKKLLTQTELNRYFPETPGKITGTTVAINRIAVKVSKSSK